jgi:hypothetical protein
MKYFILTVLLLFPYSKSKATAEIIVNPQYGYGVINILGGDKVPTYKGTYLSVDAEYRFISEKMGLGVYGNLMKGSYENTANNATQREDLDLEGHSFGLKLYYGKMYFKAGYGRINLENVSSETSTALIIRDSVYTFGLGFKYPASSYIHINAGVDVKYAKFDPTPEGVSNRADFYHYGAFIGLEILLPSMPLISK